VSLIGRPNVGKSSLLNRLVGEKLAITSPRPQTTRNRITGILTFPHAQIVFVDTPGFHEPTGKLGRFMLTIVQRSLEDVDVVCFVAEATERIHELDENVLKALSPVTRPVFCCLNKADLVKPKTRILPLIEAYQSRHPFTAILPVSAVDGTNLDRLKDLIVAALPQSPPFFPPEVTTDQPETFFVAEIIREKIFRSTHQEVPYACAVRVEELIERGARDRLYIRAIIFVEQDSQKAIVIGARGAMLQAIGSAARAELEAFFGIKVFLDLRVEVQKHWRRDDRALRGFGFMLTS
jgi:GTP-binding protein Era